MKKIFGEKKIQLKKIFVKIFFDQKDFCQKKKFWSKTIVREKKFGQTKFLVKKFWLKKVFKNKKFCSRKYFG